MGRRLERATQGREGMTGWTLSTFYNGLARLDWRPGSGPVPGLWTEATGWSATSDRGRSPGARADAAKAEPDLSGMAWRLLDEVKAESSPRLKEELGELGAHAVVAEVVGEEGHDGAAAFAAAAAGAGGDDGMAASAAYNGGGSSSSSSRSRGKGKKGKVPTGARLWVATDEWLVAQGQGENRWGDVLEPQQLTQLLWSLAAMGPPIEAEGLFRRLLGAAVARLGPGSSSSSSSSTTTSSTSGGSAQRGRGQGHNDEEEEEEEDGRREDGPGARAGAGVSSHALRQLRQVARFAELVLGWAGVQAAVGCGGPEGEAAEAGVGAGIAEPEQPTSSSMLHMEVLRLMARDLRAHDARVEVDDGVYVQDIVLMPRPRHTVRACVRACVRGCMWCGCGEEEGGEERFG
jgi:hypothetical protein